MTIIHWRTNKSFTGHGEPLDDATAEAWLPGLREAHPDIQYWLEPISDSRTPSSPDGAPRESLPSTE